MLSNAETIPALIIQLLKARGGSHRANDNGLDSSTKCSRGNDIFGEYLTGPQNIEDLVYRAVCDGELQRIKQMSFFKGLEMMKT